jgi:hypothetical protein
LQEKNLIIKYQLGFSKKARTSDHIFVLKTLIDKYLAKKDGKLFACFIDLRRAFDTVIHAGIGYKLLKNNISGVDSYTSVISWVVDMHHLICK